MKTFIGLFLIAHVFGHSAPSCTQKTGKTSCAGYPRYYHFNHLPIPLPSSDSNDTFYASRDRETLIQSGINRICPEMNIPEYSPDFPMARGYPGETLTLQHPPRGHSQQPSSPVWIYYYPRPNVFPLQKQLDPSKFILVAQFPFNSCSGIEKEISWANCTGTVTLPKSLTTGIYTFWWRWDLNGIPYSDCFEVNVSNHQSQPSLDPMNCSCLK